MESGYTVEQAALEIGCSSKSIRNYIKKGLLSAKMDHGKLIISLESLRTLSGKKAGKVERKNGSLSTVTVDLSYLEGLLTKNAQLQAQASMLLEHKRHSEELAVKVGNLETLVDDLEYQLQSERSRGFWSRLFRR